MVESYFKSDLTPNQIAQFAEVMSHMGVALWQIQRLEGALGAYLVLVHKADPATARIEVEAVFAKAGKNAFGRLLRAIKSTEDVCEEFPKFDRFVEKRNWLVHHLRHESRSDLDSESKRSDLVERIAGIADDACALIKHFASFTSVHWSSSGLWKEPQDDDTRWRLSQLNEWLIWGNPPSTETR